MCLLNKDNFVCKRSLSKFKGFSNLFTKPNILNEMSIRNIKKHSNILKTTFYLMRANHEYKLTNVQMKEGFKLSSIHFAKSATAYIGYGSLLVGH